MHALNTTIKADPLYQTSTDDEPCNPDNMTASLVLKASQGCKRAEAQIIQLMRPKLIKHVTRAGLCDDAEDIAHDALIITLKNIRALKINKPEKLQAFLFQTATNLCIGLKRKQSRRGTFARSDIIDQTASDLENVELEVEWKERFSLVQDAIESLPTPRDRTILYRVFFFEEDRSSVSNSLDMKEEHLSRCVYRAKQRLKNVMEPDYASY